MSFKLVLDIRGLCLLVPHGGKLHVLLPDTGAHPGMEHVAFFKFKGGRPREAFDGVLWDLSAIGGTFDGTLPGAVVDAVKYIRPAGVPLSQLTPGNGQKNVSSHLILGAGRCTRHGKVAQWKIAGDRMVRMTNKIRWEIDSVPDAELNWVFQGLTGAGRTPDPLVPRGTDRVVELDLMHAPRPEHDQPDDVNGTCDSNAHNHFHMYFPLFPDNLGHEPQCEPEAEVLPESAVAEGMIPDDFSFGPNVFTCMVAQSTKVDPNS